jgi:hypothetical protein
MSRPRLVALLRLLGALLLVLGSVPMATAAVADDTTTVSAKALTDHECNSSEWHFVMTGLDADDEAPSSIDVSWSGGASATVALSRVTGGVAHYSTTAHLDATVTSATATMAAGWTGQFNLSHGPCGTTGGGGGSGTESTSVTAGTPTVDESCADDAAVVTIPSTEHVSYTLNGAAASAGTHQVAADASGHYSVMVVATAASGFTLTGTTSWDLSGTLACGTSGGTAGTGTTTPGGTGSTGTGTGGVAAGGAGTGTTGGSEESAPDTAVFGSKAGSVAGAVGGVLPHTGPAVALGALVATGGGLILLGVLLLTRRLPQLGQALAPARGRHRATRRG